MSIGPQGAFSIGCIGFLLAFNGVVLLIALLAGAHFAVNDSCTLGAGVISLVIGVLLLILFGLIMQAAKA